MLKSYKVKTTTLPRFNDRLEFMTEQNGIGYIVETEECFNVGQIWLFWVRVLREQANKGQSR